MNRRLSLCGMLLIAFGQLAYAGEPNPRSKRTPWRIPSNAAATAVGSELKWHLTDLQNGGVSLQAGLAEHHSYEQAWSYYTKMFGLKSSYTARNKQQERIVENDKRSLTEHDRDQVFKAGRWARMYGKFGNYRTSLSLYDDPTLTKTHRVYVRIDFKPE